MPLWDSALSELIIFAVLFIVVLLIYEAHKHRH